MGSRRDVARAAGVSVRTVSNVVNGYAHVAEATRARVLQAIADLDYRPSELARSLKRGRSGLIGLVLPELDTPYFAELTRAFVEEGASRGLTVVIDQTDGDLERERYLIDRTEYGSLFDALVISPLALTPAHLDAISDDRPLVFLGENPFPRFDHVMIDNRLASRQAVRHLFESGRRRIAAIGTKGTDHGSSSQRLAGYHDALRDAGLGESESIVEHVDRFRRADGAAAMARLLDRPDPPDAVFCFSDPLALGALRTLATRGVRVPHDVAVVGFDDIEDGAFSTPSLTTISPDKRFIARTALGLVERKLSGTAESAALVIAPHALILRESSAPSRP
ncbi:LacI family transcriptional regulator [Lacisediminihabitans profunda]|uniref:LacI family transcriptional regulator n=1 Tax=Lacisediminihabitans profunda TaxID=2594790 RepID=A0A5C8UMU6_9MICO|nr:LacI family transcriptional regulator [Lacisediminihabitans profunda]